MMQHIAAISWRQGRVSITVHKKEDDNMDRYMRDV